MELTRNERVFFDEITHTYVNEKDELLTGVTTMMKKMGVAPDYGDIPDDVLEYAAARGSAVHQAIESWCKGEPVDVAPEFEEVAYNDLRAFQTTGIRPLANEYLVSDNEHIASSIDIVAPGQEPGRVDLIDIKTTALVHKAAVAWQLSIYRHLFEMQNPGIQVANLWCLHIRDGRARMIPVEGIPETQVQELIRCFIAGLPYSQEGLVPTDDQKKAVKALEELERAIVALDTQIKEYKAKQEALRGGIISFMKAHNLKKWEPSESLGFTYIDPTTRASLDSARLKKEQPDIYNAYLKEAQVKESLRINLK